MIDKQPSPETAKLLLTLIRPVTEQILKERENSKEAKTERISDK